MERNSPIFVDLHGFYEEKQDNWNLIPIYRNKFIMGKKSKQNDDIDTNKNAMGKQGIKGRKSQCIDLI